jgi:hypothetical protein
VIDRCIYNVPVEIHMGDGHLVLGQSSCFVGADARG